MKRYLVILSLVVLASCSKWLDVKPRGYDIPGTIEQYEGLLFGTEAFFMDEVFEYMSFEFTSSAEDYPNTYTAMGRAVCNAYKWQKDIFLPDENCGEWNTPCAFLYPLNVVVAEVMGAAGASEQKRTEILSEARVLRAWHIFLMAQFFAPPYDDAIAGTTRCIPLITEAKTVGAEFPLRTMKEVYDFVLDEMKASVPLLPQEKEHHLRVFKATGYAMLGKVLWMMGKYSEAEPYLETAFTAAKAQGAVLLDYNTLMQSDGSIELPTDQSANPEYLYLLATMARLMPAVNTSYYAKAVFPIKEEVLFDFYTKGDTRLATWTGIKSRKTAYASFKKGDKYAANISGMLTNIGIGVPDLYLMYAECLARAGKNTEAAALLTELRSHRMGAADAADLDADLVVAAVRERVREYAGYGNLWFDMRRLWKDDAFQFLKAYYTHTDGTDTYTLTQDRLFLEIPPVVKSWHPEYDN
ncbi:MAG: RagB/SusD family nutrient uptake outer membrane protein [Bacteroidales bacterium]|nr:RagB/SusD family nutrient uptake outer membrane protein [Bacteroidales bacterium]